MTPLAHSLARQLTLAPKDRRPFWHDNSDILRSSLEDVHFFECTEIIPLAMDVVKDISVDWMFERMFLPAPKTWIEWRAGAARAGILLWERGGPKKPQFAARVFLDNYMFEAGSFSKDTGKFEIPAGPIDLPPMIASRLQTKLARQDFLAHYLTLSSMLLPFINSPRIIGRTTRLPHRALERQLKSKYPTFGKYPLHAWSELKLEVNIRHKDEHTGEVKEAYLTGKKCLHFCRQHLRIRLGRLELVGSHWRGDPSLGIKRTRYRVTPARAQESA